MNEIIMKITLSGVLLSILMLYAIKLSPATDKIPNWAKAALIIPFFLGVVMMILGGVAFLWTL